MLTSEELINQIGIEDIIDIMIENGSDEPKYDNDGNMYFTTICHGGKKRKLHFFTESKFFMCYTSCGSLSLFDVLMNANNWTFKQSFNYIANFANISTNNKHKGLRIQSAKNLDLDFLDIHLYAPTKTIIQLPKYDKTILDYFSPYYPDCWEDEGITPEIMQHYGIKFWFEQYKGIIPHFNAMGDLVGIRGRNFYDYEIKAGKKYIPITVQGLTYRYPKNFNLYGIYQNKDNIRNFKKAIIFESEKSVLKYASYFGQENNISVASLGMTLSTYQRDLIVNQDVEEVIICMDKQYEIEYIDDKDTDQYREFQKYVKNLIKITKLFMNYCNISFVLCWDGRIDYKDAPIDKGKEVFSELLRDRYMVTNIEELEELIS